MLREEIEKKFLIAERRQFLSRGRLAIAIATFLVISFWLVDWFFVGGDLALKFLYFRLGMIPFSLISWLLFGAKSIKEKFEYIPGHIMCLYLGVYNSALVAYTGYEESSYYAGLNLVSFGSLFFLPWNWKNAFISVGAIYGPYVITVLFLSPKNIDLSYFVPHLAFCLSTIFMGLITMRFTKKLRRSEFEKGLLLQHELETKEAEIRQKTQDGILFEKISKQFSPSVIQSLKNNPSALDQMTRRYVTCFFIDIEKSTSRAVRIDHDDYTDVLDDFLSNTARILLSHDMTIGAYLGDGLLAFANAPMTQENHQLLAAKAAISILQMHHKRKGYLQEKWRHDFNIRIGINSGFASVGFFPSATKSTYTAIGTDVSLASRICDIADPNTLAVTKDLAISILKDIPNVEIRNKGMHRDVQGFEGENIELLVIVPQFEPVNSEACPQCGGKMAIRSTYGEMVFLICTVCGHQDLRDIA